MPATIAPRDDAIDAPIPSLDAFPATGEPKHAKLAGWDFYASIGSPKHVVAPMVDQSELAWRILSRRYGAQLVYTPMINSRRFAETVTGKKGLQNSDFFIAKDAAQQEEGASVVLGKDTDEPVFVQFCGNEPDVLLKAAKEVEAHCQAVDLNLGCPQDIARRGHYGAYLQSDWQLIFRLINALHIHLRVPVTAKMRVYESTERTVAYARMLERAGAQIITVHGRTREMKGHKTGIADVLKIQAVKQAVKVPVFANGNVLYHEDVQRVLDATGADGLMTAEGNLYNPAIFVKAPPTATELYPLAPALPFPRITALAREYLAICEALHTPTRSSAIRGHLFRLARPALEVHRHLRPALGKAGLDMKKDGKERTQAYRAFIDEMDALLTKDEQGSQYTAKVADALAHSDRRTWQAVTGTDEERPYVPHWLAQPHYRNTLPPADEAQEETEARQEKRKQRVQETEAGQSAARDVEAGPNAGAMAALASEPEAKRMRDTVEAAQAHKVAANALFGKSDYEQAILEYTEALNCLPPRPKATVVASEGTDVDVDGGEEDSMAPSETRKGKARQVEDEEQSEIRLLRSVVYANLAACHGKLTQHKETVVACIESLKDDPTYVKALHRRAQANEQIGTWSSLSSALEDYKSIQSLPHPTSLDPSLRAALQRIPPRIDETSAREKDEMLGKLKGIGDSVLGWFGLSTDNFQMQQGEGGGYSLNFVNK